MLLSNKHINQICFTAQVDLSSKVANEAQSESHIISPIMRRRISLFSTPEFSISEEKTLTLRDLINDDFEGDDILASNKGNYLRRIALVLSYKLRKNEHKAYFKEKIDLPEIILNAALNGDFNIVKLMLDNNPNYLYTSGKATAMFGGFEVERSGTPLQMAIYSRDDIMVAYFKELMEPEEFESQLKEVFAKAVSPETLEELKAKSSSALDYNRAVLEVQRKAAQELCANLMPNPLFTREEAYKNTIEKLQVYITNNPICNPYIMEFVYNYYLKIVKDELFSTAIIGGVQSMLPVYWLQLFQFSIFKLEEKPKLEITRDYPRIATSLGKERFISISGSGLLSSEESYQSRRVSTITVATVYKSFIKQQNMALEESFKPNNHVVGPVSS